jgi:hypothetical protein
LREFCEVSEGSLDEQLEFNGAQTALARKKMQLESGLRSHLQTPTDIGLYQSHLVATRTVQVERVFFIAAGTQCTRCAIANHGRPAAFCRCAVGCTVTEESALKERTYESPLSVTTTGAVAWMRERAAGIS